MKCRVKNIFVKCKIMLYKTKKAGKIGKIDKVNIVYKVG